MSSPRYLPVLLALLALASLIGAIVLDIWGTAGQDQQAWTGFLAFSAALLGVHIPAPGQTTTAPPAAG